MRSALVAVVLGTFVLVLVIGVRAAAADDAIDSTHLAMSSSTTTVSGKPVQVRVRLTDPSGHAVAGALIRLVTTTTFLGARHDEVLDEAVTASDGRAVLTFSPVDPGTTVVRARYEGEGQHGPAEASLTFDVRAAVPAYHPVPVGIQAPWAHSYFILVPFLGVWVTYAVVLAEVRKLRRAGAEAPNA